MTWLQNGFAKMKNHRDDEAVNRNGLFFLRRINMREQLIKEVEIIPLEIIVRNYAAGSLVSIGLEPGTQLPRSIIEFCYKDDALGDPMVFRRAHHRVRLGHPRRTSTTSSTWPSASTTS